MASFLDPILVDDEKNEGDIGLKGGGEEDAFLEFVEYARSVLSSEERCDLEDIGECSSNSGPPWSWIVSRILRTCSAYSSGVTSAILLSDLSQAWDERNRFGAPKQRPGCISQLKRKYKRTKLPNTVTIDSVYEKNFLSTNSILEVVVVDVYVLPGTNIYMLSLGDIWSSSTIDLYLHRRYYDLVDLESPDSAILKKGREIILTGCCLRAAIKGMGHLQLLPTEYMVILLDENQDEDAMLLGAQFCSDCFSSISLDAVNSGISYSFYTRIESIGVMEDQGSLGSTQRVQITLVDNDGSKLKFLLWGEQVLLANLFSVGSMLALDRPYIASASDCNVGNCEEICIEYGSATQLYLVPFILNEEQVCIASQTRYQGSKPFDGSSQNLGVRVSQVVLPCDSQGTVDFSNYPFRSFVMDLRDKMSSVSLYGTVTDIYRESSIAEPVFVLKVEDTTGAVLAKLHFVKSWSLGRLSLGHMIYISGLTCHMTFEKQLEVSWFEQNPGASLVNLSSLPALLNSSCLHKLNRLSDLSSHHNVTYICNVWLDHIEHQHVHSRFVHSLCGHFVCEKSDKLMQCHLCQCTCASEVMPTFHVKIVLADESTKIFAWCTGQTAAELLQISPEEFYDLSEEEQAMYLYTLENEKFIVAIVNSNRKGSKDVNGLSPECGPVTWEMVRALKCE